MPLLCRPLLLYVTLCVVSALPESPRHCLIASLITSQHQHDGSRHGRRNSGLCRKATTNLESMKKNDFSIQWWIVSTHAKKRLYQEKEEVSYCHVDNRNMI